MLFRWASLYLSLSLARLFAISLVYLRNCRLFSLFIVKAAEIQINLVEGNRETGTNLRYEIVRLMAGWLAIDFSQVERKNDESFQ